MRKRNSLFYVRFGKRVTVGDVLFLKWENGKTERCKVEGFSNISNEPISEKGRHVYLDYVVWGKSSLKGSKVKDKRIFKVRRKVDGLYATKKGYGGVYWTDHGSMWKGAGPLKLAFRYGSLTELDSEIEIVIFELKETGTLKLEEL